MDIRFLAHNSHLEEPDSFDARDPHLRLLREQPLIHRSEFLDLLPRQQAGIFRHTTSKQKVKLTSPMLTKTASGHWR